MASGTEGTDDLLSSQLVDELNSYFIPDTYAATGAEGHTSCSLERVRVVDLHRTSGGSNTCVLGGGSGVATHTDGGPTRECPCHLTSTIMPYQTAQELHLGGQ